MFLKLKKLSMFVWCEFVIGLVVLVGRDTSTIFHDALLPVCGFLLVHGFPAHTLEQFPVPGICRYTSL